MYADFSYYRDVYKGTAVADEDAYAAVGRHASLFIDQITFNRLHQSWLATTDAVKMAACAVADSIKQYEAAAEQVVSAAALKSETVGGWSGTYQDTTEARAAIESVMMEAARPYLIYTGLMDRSIGGWYR